MKVLALYDYPPSPGGLATQGDLLYKGLKEIGVDVCAVNFESAQEKEWYYRWFEPHVASCASPTTLRRATGAVVGRGWVLGELSGGT
jgi:hypothetical protein